MDVRARIATLLSRCVFSISLLAAAVSTHVISNAKQKTVAQILTSDFDFSDIFKQRFDLLLIYCKIKF